MRYRFVLIGVAAAMLVTATSAQAFVAKLQAPTHDPKAGQPWPIKVGAHRKSGKRLHASAYYAFLVPGMGVVQICKPLPNQPGGQVCTSNPHPSNIGNFRHKFFGSYRDVVVWPQKATIAPSITFRVVIHVRHGGTKHVDYPVKVHG